MNLIFFMKSATVDITKYNIKDIPGSSGRIDVISRCILAAILEESKLAPKTQIWIFLDNYRNFVFNSEDLDYESFPKNELLLTDAFVNLIREEERTNFDSDNALSSVKIVNLGFFDALKHFIEGNFKIYILNEYGEDFFTYLNEITLEDKVLFVIGSQSGKILNSRELLELNLLNLSLGYQSYLASSVIRIIKMNLNLKI